MSTGISRPHSLVWFTSTPLVALRCTMVWCALLGACAAATDSASAIAATEKQFPSFHETTVFAVQQAHAKLWSGHNDEHGMWCDNAQETIAFMATQKKPWIAFKVLAAGAIHPRQAFQWAFESGADFICVGMFDFQVVENTAIADRALAAVAQKGRARAWMA